MARGPAHAVWKTINDCLVNNRCWLCKQVFQKGKIKKVFMVSDIVRCLLRRRDQIAARVEAYNSTLGDKKDATTEDAVADENGEETARQQQKRHREEEERQGESLPPSQSSGATPPPPPPPPTTTTTADNNAATDSFVDITKQSPSSSSSSSAASTEITSVDFDSWPDVDKKIENLRAAWEAYAIHGEDFNQMDDHLLSAQVSTWMSGLVCCLSEECHNAYNIVMDQTGPAIEDDPILQQVKQMCNLVILT